MRAGVQTIYTPTGQGYPEATITNGVCTMIMLVSGVLLWSVLHLVPAAARGPRQAVIDRLGENGYKGLFSLLMLGAIALMVFGWKNSLPKSVYVPSQEMRLAALALVVVGFVFMAATCWPTVTAARWSCSAAWAPGVWS